MEIRGENIKIFCELELGDNTLIGSNVIIGYPDRIKIKSIVEGKYNFANINTDKVSIGSNTIVRDGAILYERVRIGNHVNCGHNFQIREDSSVGNNCIIGTKSIIENKVSIGEKVCLQSGSFVCPNAVIGNNVTFGPNVTFLDSKYLDYNLRPSEGPVVKNNAKIGGNVTILPGIIIGENSVIGAGSVVTKDVPDGEIFAGNPAKSIKFKSSHIQ